MVYAETQSLNVMALLSQFKCAFKHIQTTEVKCHSEENKPQKYLGMRRDVWHSRTKQEQAILTLRDKLAVEDLGSVGGVVKHSTISAYK